MKPIKPENILADGQDTAELNGRTVRKGTVAAALANLDILQSPISTAEEKIAAKNMIIELAPDLIAIGLHQHLTWKNPEIEKIIQDTIAKNN